MQIFVYIWLKRMLNLSISFLIRETFFDLSNIYCEPYRFALYLSRFWPNIARYNELSSAYTLMHRQKRGPRSGSELSR